MAKAQTIERKAEKGSFAAAIMRQRAEAAAALHARMKKSRSKAPAVHVIDFETEAIQPRPLYPPKPVGVSIRKAGEKRSRYYAFGHPTENNCTKQEAIKALREVWDSGTPILCHNAKFDYDVAVTHMGMRELPWDRIHDTQYLVFLHNPHAKSVGLKESAAEILGIPPAERDAVREWLEANGHVKKGQKWGAFIHLAPGKLVGKYAEGDTDRTLELFQFLYHSVCVERGMLEAYDVERELMPHLLENERAGIRTDLPRLKKDHALYVAARDHVEAWLRKRLKAPDLDFNKKEKVAEALAAAKIVTDWEYSAKTGKRLTNKHVLTIDKFRDAKVANALNYRNRLQTALSTFMGPWLAQAAATGGTIHCVWNSVRSGHGNDNEAGGARTGRFSSTPNFQNIPNEFDDVIHPDHITDFVAPGEKKPGRLPPLPYMRSYLLPDKGHVWLSRDYSQQEPRILAHFTNDAFTEAYRKNPKLDPYVWLANAASEAAGHKFDRKTGKILTLAITYGLGDGELAARLGVTVQQARNIKRGLRRMMPGLERLEKEIKTTFRMGQAITTWGGRKYHVEPPKYVEKFKRIMTFEYKGVNILIQGSAADCTKRAMLAYFRALKKTGSKARFLVCVHDEINVSAPRATYKADMALLRKCMDGVKFSVPMRSEGEYGPNWFALSPFKEIE